MRRPPRGRASVPPDRLRLPVAPDDRTLIHMTFTVSPTGSQDSSSQQNGSGPDEAHRIPDGVSQATVEALGDLSEALEHIERARGHLYSFHQASGTGDLTLGKAVKGLRDAGHADLADRIESELVGRNVIAGRWTFQIVEEYDDSYWSVFRRIEKEARDELVRGRRHLYEAQMKEDERTHGRPDHEARPDEAAG